MNIKIEEVMVSPVITTHKHKSVGRVKEIMKTNRVNSIPIVTEDQEVEGIVTLNDLNDEISDDTRIAQIMTTKVLTVPRYSGVHIAARIMRNHHIHHLVVTHEKKIVGVLSSFDLIKLVEKHRFVAKNAPTPPKKGGKRK